MTGQNKKWTWEGHMGRTDTGAQPTRTSGNPAVGEERADINHKDEMSRGAAEE